ncbi:DUF6706 family protein [Pedobacter panaciterrae]|uniref:DUF6706 family protein n=1 Tax=Pedobacter panaciterrae TaxID=363849 RepID=A0ABU8NV20_9SPHI
MTIKEALTSTVAFILPKNRIEKALIDAELDGSADYTKASEKAIDLCMAGLLITLITSADETEDDLSTKLPNRDVLIKAFSALYRKWNLVDPFSPVIPKPTVRQITPW